MSNDQLSGPATETFILLNGLSTTEDDVLGDYVVRVTSGEEGTSWVLTARLSGGDFIWRYTGVVTARAESDRYTVTVTEYTESDCHIDTYGETN